MIVAGLSNSRLISVSIHNLSSLQLRVILDLSVIPHSGKFLQKIFRRLCALSTCFIQARYLRVEDLQVVNVALAPLNLILRIFIDKTDALENICNIIDASLGHSKPFHSIIEVDTQVGGAPDDVDELEGQLAERLFGAVPSSCLSRLAIHLVAF